MKKDLEKKRVNRLALRLSDEDLKTVEKLAEIYTKGNVSEIIRMSIHVFNKKAKFIK